VRATGRVVLNFFRPWPIQPLIALALIPFYLTWSIAAVTFAVAANVPAPSQVQLVISVVLPVALLGGIFYLVQRHYGPRTAPSPVVYYAILLLASGVSYFSRMLSLNFSESTLSDTQLWNLFGIGTPIASIIRTAIALLLLNSIFGIVGVRLLGEVRRAEDALALAKLQQQRLVQADEATRRQVSSVLHDEIQSSILTIGMQVEQIARDVPAETGDRLRSIADELEYVRGERLHGVIAELAPEFSLVGMRQAVTSLSRRYRKTMAVTLDLDPEVVRTVESDMTMAEAVYRITEQALLNSAAHGRASAVVIRLAEAGDVVILTVTDDGQGLNQVTTPGLGTVVTDAWVSQLGGLWVREPARPRGVKLRVRLPLPRTA